MAERKTRQRAAILEEIQRSEGPLSVSEVHERASRDLPRLGIATVYRALGALRESGEIVSVSLPGEEARYEPVGRGHHHHFRCRACEQTFDLEVCPVGIPEGTTLPGGYYVEDHHLTFYGRCSECAGSER